MSKARKEKYYTKYLTVCQGDVLLINYGKANAGCRTSGIRPSVVVSNDTAISTEKGFFVVPLYRNPSKSAYKEDILVRPYDCRGLRYEEYAQPMNLTLCCKCRVIRKIGHIKNDTIVKEIANVIWDLVGQDAG